LCPVKTESLSRAVFEIMGLKDIGIMTLTFHGHVTSSMTSSFDAPQAIYKSVIGTKPLSQSVFEISASKYECLWTHTHTSRLVDGTSMNEECVAVDVVGSMPILQPRVDHQVCALRFLT